MPSPVSQKSDPQPVPCGPGSFPGLAGRAPGPVPRAFAGLPFSGLPFHGVTVLLVEDSRFASDAMRLLCQKSGARLRRAETLWAARQHLRVYRPDVVIVDLGLPDGRGEDLIRDLAGQVSGQSWGRMLVLATSGEASGRETALAAGAQGFLEKPVPSLAVFQQALAPALGGCAPRRARHAMPIHIYGFQGDGDLPMPDPLALSDDLRRAADLVCAGPGADPQIRQYLSGFLSGVARHAQDPDLARAAQIGEGRAGLDQLARWLTRRLGGPDPQPGSGAFRPQ